MSREEYIELVKKANKWASEYYDLDNPTASDEEYDGAYNVIVQYENENNFVHPDSPTLRVGGKIDNRFKKVAHQNKMYSLSNAFNTDDLIKFDDQIKRLLNIDEDLEYVAEYKIDGLSISLLYENGKLIKGVTRGDGITGEDVTHNVLTISDIPREIAYKEPLEVRGEIFMKKSVLNELNESGLGLANPRNAASGTMRQLDSSVAASRKLSSYIYSMPNAFQKGFNTHKEVLEFLTEMKFNVNDKTVFRKSILDISSSIEELTTYREKADYEIDGIVIKVNDNSLHEDIGYTMKSPKFMIAYKFPAEIGKTRLDDIFATVGRTGRITYNAKLSPLRLAGTTVQRATLHNADYIREIGINVGDIVKVKKAGEIIPKVFGVSEKVNTNEWEEHTECPTCKSELQRVEGEVDQYCVNRECEVQFETALEHFVSKKCFNIDGLSIKLLQTFIKNKFVTNFSDIFALSRYKEDILKLSGFKEKSVNNILNAIEKSKKVSLERFIFAIGIRHIGEKNSKILARRFGSLEAIMNSSFADIITIRELGTKGAQSIVDYFQAESNIAKVERLLKNGVSIAEQDKPKSEKLQNKTFVITGTLSKPRSHFAKIIEENGGNVSSSISKNTSYLLAGEKAGSKLTKATQLNVQVINEDELDKLLDY